MPSTFFKIIRRLFWIVLHLTAQHCSEPIRLRRAVFKWSQGWLPNPVVIDSIQQGDKHIRQPQVYFEKKTMDTRSLFQLFSVSIRFYSLLFTLPASHFCLFEAMEIGKIGVELCRTQSGVPTEKFLKVITKLPINTFFCSLTFVS